MKTLIVGGGAGSWEIRGRQLGKAIGASVTTSPSINDWRGTDVAVIVKRAIATHGAIAKAARCAVVWDALDYWQQPDESGVAMDVLIAQAQVEQHISGVSTLIGATQAMAADLGGVYLPHHSRPGLVVKPVRREAKVVAYEGTPKYLGSWRVALEDICAKLGLAFVVNPPSLADADIVVAFRGEKWDGEVCRRWKSGVKYVNAMAAGRPVLTQQNAAWHEILPPGRAIEQQAELEQAIVEMLPYEFRQWCADKARVLAQDYTLNVVAARYRDILAHAMQRAA